ncbi:MAG: response regulator [Alphaproteobacteria bacterium]|nr:response regulator [Alphaproteobacteria bacterium]
MTNRAAQAIRILVIDDQKTMRSIIRNLLAVGDIHHVMEASDGIEGWENLLDRRQPYPDVIICDLHMKNMDGMEFCNRVRLCKDEEIRGIPVLILTGERDKMPLEVAAQVGATAILGKPISAPDLCHQIESAVGFAFDG